ncbi:MAG: hypothetical protein Q8M40_12990 [Legionella sp.]|nr:hypothetical protein [Legionella sp.]
MGCYKNKEGEVVPLGRRIPKGVQRILDVIDENNDCLETLSKIHDIVAYHGHYTSIKMFFIGQMVDTRFWYQKIERGIEELNGLNRLPQMNDRN